MTRTQQQDADSSRHGVDVVQLDHHAVYASDRGLSAEFIATVLGLEVGSPSGRSSPSTWGTA